MPRYRAFGLDIEANQAIAALEHVRRDDRRRHAGALRIELGVCRHRPTPPSSDPWYRSGLDAAGHSMQVWRRPGCYDFYYPDGASFVVGEDGGSVHAEWPPNLTVEDACEYLLGPILGFVLRLRGTVCLHASAVTDGTHCFAFLAPAGHGKSSAAAACAQLGLRIVTDDLLALQWRRGRFFAVPAYPRVRLWPESVEGLFGSAEALPRITPGNPSWDKRFLDVTGPPFAFAEEPAPLTAIYTHACDANPVAALETASPAEALVTLVANVYSRCRCAAAVRRREFEVLDRLARAVPVRRFGGRRGLQYLQEHCRLLHEDCIRSGAAAATPR